jgi:Ca2+/Na+ antiporter
LAPSRAEKNTQTRQEPSEVGVTGLLWLLLSYGFVLYQASNLISEGSELLLLVPELAGLVGGVVLPLLGSVPDGAIILFSGLGDLEEAQETLQVGVGTLAGSTIMLLTVPFCLSVFAGRVDYGATGQPNYFAHPKVDPSKTLGEQLFSTGITVTDGVKHSGIVMMLTTIPYLLIQVPALFLHGPAEEVGAHERWWALSGLVVCLAGLAWYLHLQLRLSREGEDRGKRMAVVKKLLQKGRVSLSGAVAAKVRAEEHKLLHEAASEYQSTSARDGGAGLYPPPAVANYLKEILGDAFTAYDANGNGQLDKREVLVFFRDFHEAITEQECDSIFSKFDLDQSGTISFDEFIAMSYTLIKMKDSGDLDGSARGGASRRALVESAFEAEEAEEVPEEFTSLAPDRQQAAIKKRAFLMLFFGTALVALFSDPMVDVLQEVANRVGLSSFYVSFVLAPLASNASELLSSIYYASKKTRKTIAVSLSALCGAAALNNTFCLSIFFLLIFFRGLAWQFTAETISIVTVELVLGFLVQRSSVSLATGLFVMSIFPLSLVLVATLEYFGFD